MNNDDKLKKLVEAARNEKPLFSITEVEHVLDQNNRPKALPKYTKTIAIMSLIIIISSIIFFQFNGAKTNLKEKSGSTIENITLKENEQNKALKDQREAHKITADKEPKLIDTSSTAKYENRTVYNVIPYKPATRKPFVYDGVKNNITGANKPVLEDYFPELTDEEWTKLNMTINWRKLNYLVEEGDSAVQQFEISSNYGSFIRHRGGVFSNTESERFLPLGISKENGSRFLNFTIDAHEIMDSLKDDNQILAIKTKTINNVVVWYKIDDNIISALSLEVANKISKNTLAYNSTFKGNNENKLNEPSKPLAIMKPILSKSRTYQVNISRDEIDSSLIKDTICYNSELAITPDEATLNSLGVSVLDNGIDLKGHVFGGKTSLKITGGESHSLRHSMTPNGKSKGFAPIYISGIYDNKGIHGLLPSWYYGTNNTYKHFLEKRHNYLPVLVHTPSNDSTLVLWYEPSFALFEKLGYEPVKQRELMQKFVSSEYKTEGTQLHNAEFDFVNNNDHLANQGIKLLELDNNSLAKLEIFTENDEIIFFKDRWKYKFHKGGTDMAFRATTFSGNNEKKQVTIEIPNTNGGISYTLDTNTNILAPKYITDDLAQSWRVSVNPEGVDIKTKNRIDVIDSLMRVDMTSNYLIPVLVKSGANYTVLDKTLGKIRPDCIFWYEPTEEFLNHLPDSIAQGIRAELEHMVYTDIIYQAKDDSIIVEKAKAEILKNENENPEQCTYFEACRNQTLAVSEFNVYPNPVKELLFVNLESDESCEGQLIITDIKGRQLANTQIKIAKGTNSYSIPVAELNEGIFLITLTTNKGDLKTQRLVKVK